MKSALMILSALAAASVFADTTVSCSNTFGFVPVSAGDGSTRSLVSVAVPVAGYNNVGNISVADVLQTANLSEGDELYTMASGGAYNKYTLNSSGEWVAAKNVTVGAGDSVSAGAGDDSNAMTIKRGEAFWLKTAATTVRLMGEATSGNAGVEVAGSTSGTWNLIGNSNMTGSVLVSSIVGTKGDKMRLGADVYTYTASGKWKKPVFDPTTKQTTSVEAGSEAIVAGQGILYMAKGSKTLEQL